MIEVTIDSMIISSELRHVRIMTIKNKIVNSMGGFTANNPCEAVMNISE